MCSSDLTWLNADVLERGVQLTLTADLPTARELPVERALGAARWLTERLGRAVRVGVHQCTAFSGDIGSEQRRTFTIMGDGVNLTARLAASATWGTVVATDDALAAGSLRAEGARVRVVHTRGRRATVRARRVDHVAVAPHSADAPALVGRTRVLARLHDAALAAGSGEGQSVALVGAAGSGRSRVLDEFVAALPRSTRVVRVGGRTMSEIGRAHV